MAERVLCVAVEAGVLSGARSGLTSDDERYAQRIGTTMDEPKAIKAYNYATFEASEEAVFPGFRTALPVGSAAPDVAVTVADTGQLARLSDYWRGRDLVIEFGSLT